MSSKVEIQTNPATATPSLSPPSSSASTSVPPSSNKSTTTTKNNDNDNNKTSAQQDEVPMKRKIQQLQMDPLHLQHLQNVIDPCH